MPSRQWYSSAKHPPGQRRFGNSDFFQRRDHVVPNASGVGNGRVFSNPNALVNSPAEVLAELPVNVPADRGPAGIHMNDEFVFGFISAGLARSKARNGG
jgi:hypothetical protein